ncbi:4'-phosphopantetheinyl transferase family protein [Egbenema bharatensis]|uniref:4'-phosphopantetheinyl transferase family protein n=1 Tax=Egbenema bharatensis TaxID=3463334 RepID=UPI003A8456A7
MSKQAVLNISLSHLPYPLDLTNAAIHVWQAALDRPIEWVEKFSPLLSADEQTRADRFRFQHHQHRFIVSRGILRLLLASYLNTDPAELRFSYGPLGKPALANASHPQSALPLNLSFNLTHSEGFALYAFTLDRPVGIDLEYLPPQRSIHELARRFFSPREYEVICALPPTQQQAAFLQIWTYKEAYLKATGEGLTGLNQIEVILAELDEPTPAAFTIHNSAHRSLHWKILRLQPPPGYVAALAIEGNPGELVSYHLTDP